MAFGRYGDRGGWCGSISGPLVSIVVPNYNGRAYLAACLESIRSQDYRDWQCLFVDDGSGDDSVEIAEGFAREDSRFQVLLMDSNRGPAAARNRGLEAATGRYVVFQDSDDLMLPSSISTRVGAVEACGRASLGGSYCKFIPMREDGEPFVPAWRLRGLWQTPEISWLDTAPQCPMQLSAALFAAGAVRQAGGFDENIVHGAEDWEFFLRFLRYGHRLAGTGTCGCLYRSRPASRARSESGALFDTARWMHEAAESPAEGGDDGSGAFFFSQPVWWYKTRLALFRAQIRYAMVAHLQNQVDQFERILSACHPHLLDCVRHMQYDSWIEQTVLRFLCHYHGLAEQESVEALPGPLRGQYADCARAIREFLALPAEGG